MEEATGDRTAAYDKGFLNEQRHAELFRQGKSVKRLCRWCGNQMLWTNKGFFICTGKPSCDAPPKGPTTLPAT